MKRDRRRANVLKALEAWKIEMPSDAFTVNDLHQSEILHRITKTRDEISLRALQVILASFARTGIIRIWEESDNGPTTYTF